MIDLHCHILPGIDDGAQDLDDAVAMALQADEDGIGTICATPHIRHDHDVRIHELAGRVAALNEQLAGRGIESRVAVGGEVAETALAGLDPEELRQVGLGGGRWILLEPAPGPLSESLVTAVEHLSTRGFKVLLAHPERHLGPGAVAVLGSVVRAGALVQATAALLEDGDPSPVVDLATRGLIHVLGSDAHSARIGRPVRLSAGLAALARVPRIHPHASWVAETAPAAILAGDDAAPPFPPT
jgi:protein-tyrosine phosphatase